MNKFTLDMSRHSLPTLWLGGRGLTIQTSEQQAQVIVEWLNKVKSAENGAQRAQRDALMGACKEAFSDLSAEYGSTNTTQWPGLAMDAGDALKAALAKLEVEG